MCTPIKSTWSVPGIPRKQSARLPGLGFRRTITATAKNNRRAVTVAQQSEGNNRNTCPSLIYPVSSAAVVVPAVALVYWSASWFYDGEIIPLDFIESGDDTGLAAVGFVPTSLVVITDGAATTQTLYVRTNPSAPAPYDGHLALWATDLAAPGGSFFDGWLIYKL